MGKYRVERYDWGTWNALLFTCPDSRMYIWEGVADDWRAMRSTVEAECRRINGDGPVRLHNIIEYLIANEPEVVPADLCDECDLPRASTNVCVRCDYSERYENLRADGYSPADAEVEAKLGGG